MRSSYCQMNINFKLINLCSLVLVFIISCSGGSSSYSSPPPTIPDPPPITTNNVQCSNFSGSTENLIWIEDFVSEVELPDSETWTTIIGNGEEYGIPGWGNNELQFYTESLNNAKVKEGCLKITPLIQEQNGFKYTSAKLVTENKVDFTSPGKITVKFRSPVGVGMWPAIWMMPRDSIYGGWPASGEIDLVEIRGSNMQEILSTIHFGSDPSNHQYLGGSFYTSQENNLNENFHIVEFFWDADSMTFILNSENVIFDVLKSQIGLDENYPFNEIFYIIINVAIGGNFVGNYVDDSDICSIESFSQCSDSKRFLIDWITYENLELN